MSKIQETGDKVLANVERVVGKHHEVRLALVALLCRGHLRSRTCRAPARPSWPRPSPAASAARSGAYSSHRICCHVTGLSIYNQKTQEFEFGPGRS